MTQTTEATMEAHGVRYVSGERNPSEPPDQLWLVSVDCDGTVYVGTGPTLAAAIRDALGGVQ